jgi:hypothetical protein
MSQENVELARAGYAVLNHAGGALAVAGLRGAVDVG